MRFSFLLTLAAALLSVPSAVSAQGFLPVNLNVNLPDVNLDLLNSVSCEVEPARIIYIGNGENRIEFSTRYTAREDVRAPYTIQLENQSGEVVFEEEGETFLHAEIFDEEAGYNTIEFPNGDIVSRVQFPVHGSTSVTLNITANGVSCAPKTFTVIDDMTCALDGRVELVGDDRNTLQYSLQYDSPDDRRLQQADIPYEVWVLYNAERIAEISGSTFLVQEGRTVTIDNGESVAETPILLNDAEKIYVQGTLGGKKCTTAELTVARPVADLPINIADIIPGDLLPEFPGLTEEQAENAPNPDQDSDEQPVGADDADAQSGEEQAAQQDLSESMCSVVAEGVTDTNNRLFIATGLRYTHLPAEEFAYQFIGYPVSAPEERRIISGIVDGTDGPDGFLSGELFAFDPASSDDTFIVQGLIRNLVCAPVVFVAPDADSDATPALRVSDESGESLTLTGNRVQPENTSEKNEEVASDENLLNELIQEEFDLQEIIDDAFAEDEVPLTKMEVSMYVIGGILALIIVLLILIIISLRKKLPKPTV